jgi:protein-S-isoprenylcysteine O-methyltransferase Ste14
VAVVLIVVGLGITVWARRHSGPFWSGRVTLKRDHQLIQSGPYAWVRHPIYSGLLLAMLATALFVGEWRAALGALLILVTHGWKARRQEALLAGQYRSGLRGVPEEDRFRCFRVCKRKNGRTDLLPSEINPALLIFD